MVPLSPVLRSEQVLMITYIFLIIPTSLSNKLIDWGIVYYLHSAHLHSAHDMLNVYRLVGKVIGRRVNFVLRKHVHSLKSVDKISVKIKVDRSFLGSRWRTGINL